LLADVRNYVISCAVCQVTKPSQRKPAGLMVYAGVDYVGPLPRKPNGNAYILVFVDYFSKWIEVSAVREATAQVAANKFISDVFARHGAPSYLLSDRGTPFVELTLFRMHKLILKPNRPLYAGPYRVSQRLFAVNYCLTDGNTGQDAGVFHVVHLQPFHNWAIASSGGQKRPVTPETQRPETLEEGLSFDFENSDLGLPGFFTADAAGVLSDDLADNQVHDTGFDLIDSAQVSVREIDDVPHATGSPLPASIPGFSDGYNLRPRRAPRVTSGWSDNKWTNPYHTTFFFFEVNVLHYLSSIFF
uniref:Integrase catalytic domain-containing protein n=1 Tax=Mola mola TaxID=94237 RepID=A0A3Q3W4I2_MOLML